MSPSPSLMEKCLHMAANGYVFVHIPKTAGRSILSALGVSFCREHKTILDYCRELGEATLRSRFKFACVRNPWDRAVSWWSFFGNMGSERVEFLPWLEQKSKVKNRRPTQKFALDQMSYCRGPSGDVLIDHFIRFEHLDEDFKPVSERLGVSPVLPVIGKHDRVGQRQMREVLLKSKRPELAPMVAPDDYHDAYTTQESVDIVAAMDAETIKRFGYTFK